MYISDYIKLISYWLIISFIISSVIDNMLFIPIIAIPGFIISRKLRIKVIKHDIQLKEKYKNRN